MLPILATIVLLVTLLFDKYLNGTGQISSCSPYHTRNVSACYIFQVLAQVWGPSLMH